MGAASAGVVPFRDGIVDGLFFSVEKGGEDGDVVTEEVAGNGVESVQVEVTSDGRVILASLPRQDGINVGMVNNKTTAERGVCSRQAVKKRRL